MFGRTITDLDLDAAYCTWTGCWRWPAATVGD